MPAWNKQWISRIQAEEAGNIYAKLIYCQYLIESNTGLCYLNWVYSAVHHEFNQTEHVFNYRNVGDIWKWICRFLNRCYLGFSFKYLELKNPYTQKCIEQGTLNNPYLGYEGALSFLSVFLHLFIVVIKTFYRQFNNQLNLWSKNSRAKTKIKPDFISWYQKVGQCVLIH